MHLAVFSSLSASVLPVTFETSQMIKDDFSNQKQQYNMLLRVSFLALRIRICQTQQRECVNSPVTHIKCHFRQQCAPSDF